MTSLRKTGTTKRQVQKRTFETISFFLLLICFMIELSNNYCLATFWPSNLIFNPLSANPTKWSNTLKQFVGVSKQFHITTSLFKRFISTLPHAFQGNICTEDLFSKYMWCFVRFGTICTINKTWKTPMEEFYFP